MIIKKLTTLALAAGLLGSFGAPAAACGEYGGVIREPEKRHVDLAICLDTSGSMSGLIDAARQKLWTIVNDLALAEPTPRLRVALLTFGNSGHAAEDGFVLRQTDLTDDLDLVSERLFALGTNGGEEYVGRVVAASLDQLSWSHQKDALKLVIVAGNESADQDKVVSYKDACKRAISGGIMVNSIYCGNPADAIALGWQDVARLADGHYAAIDHQNGPVVIATPFDAKLTEMSTAINATYVPYGERGQWASSNQRAQDGNAEGCNTAAAAGRAVMKGGKLYCNDSWDLVDASRKKGFDLAKVERKHLPEALRELDDAKLRAHLDAQFAKRTEIQKEIAELGKKRDAHIVAERKRLADKGETGFEFVVRKAVRDQARTRGFRFTRDAEVLVDGVR